MPRKSIIISSVVGALFGSILCVYGASYERKSLGGSGEYMTGHLNGYDYSLTGKTTAYGISPCPVYVFVEIFDEGGKPLGNDSANSTNTVYATAHARNQVKIYEYQGEHTAHCGTGGTVNTQYTRDY